MNLNALLPVLIVISFVWLLILSLSFYWIVAHYNRLVKGTSDANLKKVLDSILERQDLNKKEIANLSAQLVKLDQEGYSHIQKVGITRFNPFSESGGDNSFSLALLDAKLDGVVITGLHARERTRVYLKPVQKGKSKYELSKEEKQAIEESLKTR